MGLPSHPISHLELISVAEAENKFAPFSLGGSLELGCGDPCYLVGGPLSPTSVPVVSLVGHADSALLGCPDMFLQAAQILREAGARWASSSPRHEV